MSLAMKSGRGSTFHHLLPGGARVNRALLRAGYLAARVYWFLTRPSHVGAVVALWRGDRVLLVHQTYRRCWALPGGGVGHGEDPAAAVQREVQEELGITLPTPRPSLIYPDHYERRREVVHIYEAELGAATPRPDGVEVDEVAFLTIDEALDRDPPPHVRAYLLSRRSSRRVASTP
jgi:8-oxo-dGTP diphosphatase